MLSRMNCCIPFCSGTARIVNLTKSCEADPFIVPRGALGVFGGAMSETKQCQTRRMTTREFPYLCL